MTDDNATPKPKRKPSGAAVKGGAPRPTLYPRQLVLMVDDILFEDVARIAAELRLSKSEVGRTLLTAGLNSWNDLRGERAEG
jgi:hypothetical protein